VDRKGFDVEKTPNEKLSISGHESNDAIDCSSIGRVPKKYYTTHDAVASLLRHVLEHRLLVRFCVDDALDEWHRTGAVEAPDDAVPRGRTLQLIL
jgi:hypothetical protein